MSDLDDVLDGDRETARRRLTVVDYTRGLIFPVLTIVATIIVGWNDKHPYLLRGLVVATILSILIGPAQWLWSAVRTKLKGIREERAAQKFFPPLRKLVHRFGDFVTGGPDTLHYIADGYLCQGHGQRIALLGMTNVSAWSGRADLFSRRLDRQKPGLAELHYAALEYHDLVGTYVNLCATAVFDRLPQDLATNMDPRARKELAAFQQRFERFLSDSEALLKEISQSCSSLSRLPYSFSPVKPLA
jgi:hypothetical protein